MLRKNTNVRLTQFKYVSYTQNPVKYSLNSSQRTKINFSSNLSSLSTQHYSKRFIYIPSYMNHNHDAHLSNSNLSDFSNFSNHFYHFDDDSFLQKQQRFFSDSKIFHENINDGHKKGDNDSQISNNNHDNQHIEDNFENPHFPSLSSFKKNAQNKSQLNTNHREKLENQNNNRDKNIEDSEENNHQKQKNQEQSKKEEKEEKNQEEEQQQQPEIKDSVPPDNKIRHHGVEALTHNMRMLTSYLQRQSDKSNMIAWTLFFSLLIVFVLWEPIKDWWGEQGADVASRSLSHEEVQFRAESLSKAVLNQILNDPVIMQQCATFLQELFSHSDTQEATVTLLLGVLNNQHSLDQLKKLFTQLIVHLLRQPEALDVTKQFLTDLSAMEETQTAMTDLAYYVLSQRVIQEKVNQIASETVQSQPVFVNAEELSKGVVHDILNDENIHRHAATWVNDVFNDPGVQSNAADAIWDTVWATVIPRWVRPSSSSSSSSSSSLNDSSDSSISSNNIDNNNIDNNNIDNNNIDNNSIDNNNIDNNNIDNNNIDNNKVNKETFERKETMETNNEKDERNMMVNDSKNNNNIDNNNNYHQNSLKVQNASY